MTNFINDEILGVSLLIDATADLVKWSYMRIIAALIALVFNFQRN